MTEAATIAYPEWTEYRKKNGLDPLGMQNTCVGLYQRLLPGISNVTLRIRYLMILGIIVRWILEPNSITISRRKSSARLSSRCFCVCWTIRRFSRKSALSYAVQV